MIRAAKPSALLACALALATAIACSDSDPAPGAEAPDASPPEDASRDAGDEQDAAPEASRDASYDAASEPVSCAVTPCAIALTAGAAHACALLGDGTVRCWGADSMGALGAGDTDAAVGPGPVRVANLTEVTQISAAGNVTCARTAGGRALCWGANDKGQLGLSAEAPSFDYDPHPTPAPIAVTGAIMRVDVGNDSACARLASGTLWCWGANDQSQLMRPNTDPVGVPAPLVDAAQAPLPWTRTAFGTVTGYGVTADGRLASWGVVAGRNTSTRLDPVPRFLPLTNVVDVAAGPAIVDYFAGAMSHACAIADGAIACWGKTYADDIPALCTGVPNDQRVPAAAPLSGPAYPQQIAVARRTTCVRMTDGTVECCGDDSRGQLGRGKVGDNPAVLSFTRASALQGHAVHVVTGETMTCALLRDGRVQCWGGNARGELGQAAVDEDAHPTPVTVAF